MVKITPMLAVAAFHFSAILRIGGSLLREFTKTIVPSFNTRFSQNPLSTLKEQKWGELFRETIGLSKSHFVKNMALSPQGIGLEYSRQQKIGDDTGASAGAGVRSFVLDLFSKVNPRNVGAILPANT